MIRYAFWLVVGVAMGALGLWYGESFLTRLALWLRLPGWLTVLGIFAMLALLAPVYFKVRWAELSEGDLRNFLPGIVNTCIAVAGVFSGIGAFAGAHWAIEQSGYGHGYSRYLQ